MSQRDGRRGGADPPRRSRAATATLLVLALGGCGGSGASGSAPRPASSAAPSTPAPSTVLSAGGLRTVGGSAGGMTASMHAGTHRPKVGRNWPVTFTVTRNGQFVQAGVSYEFLFGGQVVARRSHYTFHGRFHDIVVWPASAAGYQLTLRAVVRAGGATVNLDYPVQVTR